VILGPVITVLLFKTLFVQSFMLKGLASAE